METIELLKKAHCGDKEARDRLVQENVGLIWSIVKRFSGRGYELEDLFQIGCIGMIKAIDKFDFNFDVKFSTYAVPLISGELKRFLRDDGMIKISRSIKENGFRIQKARESFIYDNGRDATIDELVDITGISREDVVVSIEASSEVESIYKAVYQNDGAEVCLVDKIPETRDDNEEMINNMLLKQLLAKLKDNEKQLIYMRYFQDKTQSDVAKMLGVSQVQVSRMEKKILLRMRGMM